MNTNLKGDEKRSVNHQKVRSDSQDHRIKIVFESISNNHSPKSIKHPQKAIDETPIIKDVYEDSMTTTLKKMTVQ